ncbi:hypothetical protein ACFYVL_09295 [Streptomyces sp. NPDC004111]|uniref:hypothetical protein n=1 Tax=Streptomyces sp. NPDC004111 TaxID=3364690 RepID=UPI0036AF209E
MSPQRAAPLAPLPDHRDVPTARWQDLWRRHARITTPLRQRGLVCDVVFAMNDYVVHVALPDRSYLIISPSEEPEKERPVGDPEGWTVTRYLPDSLTPADVLYDSCPGADPGVTDRPEARYGGSAWRMIDALDQQLARLGLLRGHPAEAPTPVALPAPPHPPPAPASRRPR